MIAASSAPDDGDDTRGLSFDPDLPSAAATVRPRRPLPRRFTGPALLLAALAATGSVFAVVVPSSAAADATVHGDAADGATLYRASCLTCHGANLQGIPGRGVALIGVGAASVYFQVSTGRMPLAEQGAQAERRPAVFDEQQTLDLAAYVQSLGGGPTLPTGSLRSTDPSSLGEGGELFRTNCAACHNFAGRGGVLTSGKEAPPLTHAADLQLWTAMLTGPESMPVFGNNELSPQQKREIVGYIQTLKSSQDPGGQSLGRIGPGAEAIVAWAVGLTTLALFIFWIGSRTGNETAHKT